MSDLLIYAALALLTWRMHTSHIRV